LGDTKDLLPGKGHTFVGIEDVGLRAKGWLLGKKENGAVMIIDVRGGGKIVEEFENSVSRVMMVNGGRRGTDGKVARFGRKVKISIFGF
jgi:hypothetical protein